MEHYLSDEFWKQLYNSGIDWVITNGPPILITIILMIITLKLFKYLINKASITIIEKAKKNLEEDSKEKEKRVKTLIAILRQAGNIVIIAIFSMMILKEFGVDIGPILAGAGILGLAVGFGAQELVRDIISGFFLLLENQVRAGDVAIINGQGGLVEKIELRTITLRDFSQVVHIFQNGKINTLANMTKEWSAMVFDIGVAYKEDTEKVTAVMKKVGDDLQNDPNFSEKILEPIEIFGLDKFGDSAIVIKARIKTKPIEQWTVGREYNKRLKKAFDDANVEIPFPHRTIYWGDEINPLKVHADK